MQMFEVTDEVKRKLLIICTYNNNLLEISILFIF